MKSKRSVVVLALVTAIAVTLYIATLGVSDALGARLFQLGSTPFPTDYPFEKQTQEVAFQQTRDAAFLTPVPTGASKFSNPYPTQLPEQIAGPQGTPMGDGILTSEVGRSAYSLSKTFVETNLAWYQRIGRGEIIVYPGHLPDDEDQGALVVVRNGPAGNAVGELIHSPTKGGTLEIVDAVGSRLIIDSEQGQTFYFDVEGEVFTSSLTAVVPTITPAPTHTPYPALAELVPDDAPNVPGLASVVYPLNTDQEFFIDPSGDQDWFLFRTHTTGTLDVILSELPASYGLAVYRLADASLVGMDDTSGTQNKTVTVTDGDPDDYLVGVFGISGSFDPNSPYTLRVNSGLASFVALGQEGVWVRQNADVISGNVGANIASSGPFLASGSEVSFGPGAQMLDPESRVMGDSVFLKQNSEVYDIYYNELDGLGHVLGQEFTPVELPLISAFPAVPTFSPGTEDFDVPQNGSLTLHAGDFGTLLARNGSTVTFLSGTYNFEEWDVRQNVTLEFRAPSQILINDKLMVDRGSYFGPAPEFPDGSASDFLVYVNGINGSSGGVGATPKAARFGIGSTVIANVYVPNGTLWLRQNSTSTGSFLGKWVIVGIGASVEFEGVWR